MTPEAVTSVIAFVLNSALFTSFIIPQVQKLKEIKDELFQFQLSCDPIEFFPNKTVIPHEEVQKLQQILDIYHVRSGELQATVNKFYGSVALAGLVLISSALLPAYKNIFLTVHPVLQLALLCWAIRSYSTDPDRLSSPLYLVKECDINPYLLIKAMGLKISFACDTDQNQGWNDPFNINLSMRLRLQGFRFMFVIADDAGKVFYVSYGPITAKTKISRQLRDPAAGTDEINRIEIGKFNFNQFGPEKSLYGRLLLFMPVFKDWKLNPMLTSVTTNVPGKVADVLLRASRGATAVEETRTYQGVTYSGEGAEVHDLVVEDSVEGNNPVINRVMRKLRNDFLRASKIESITDAAGLIAAE